MKITNLIFLFLFCMFFGCNIEETDIGSIEVYDFNNDIEVVSIYDATLYVLSEIKYKSDGEGKDYWQTPKQTYDRKTGDCEDRAILLMYILKNKLGIDSTFIMAKKENLYHAVVFADDLYLLSGNIFISDIMEGGWSTVHTIKYSKVLWMTCRFHDGVGKYK